MKGRSVERAPETWADQPTLPGDYPEESPLERDSAVMNRWANETLHAHIDVMVQALRCGATRVGTLQIGDSGQQMIQPGIVEPARRATAVNGTDSHFWDARLKFEQWTSSHVRYLLDALGEDLSHTIAPLLSAHQQTPQVAFNLLLNTFIIST